MTGYLLLALVCLLTCAGQLCQKRAADLWTRLAPRDGSAAPYPRRARLMAAARWLLEQRLIPDQVLCSPARRTRETLEKWEQAGQVENAAGDELPKAFVLCSLGSGQTCYLSQLNTATLYKRSKASGLENL